MQDFFRLWNFLKKKEFLAQIFEILQGMQKPVLATPYEGLER
jgi:hypothetical protein